jgi:hypothetical protein
VSGLGGLSREELIAHALEQEARVAEVTAAHGQLVADFEQLTVAHERLKGQ